MAALVAAVALAMGCGSDSDGGGGGSEDEMHTVAIAEIASIPPIDENVAAFKKQLAKRGYKEGENVEFVSQNAQGQASNVSLISRDLVREEPDLIYALGTPLIVGLSQQTKSVPILFGIMTDPVDAGVAQSKDAPGGNLSGTSDYISAETYFDLFEQAIPDVKTVGFLGNTAEANTQSALRDFKAEAAKRDIALEVAPVANSGAARLALQSLRGRVDLVTFPADNTVSSALESVVKQATQMGLPVIASQTDTAAKGGLIGVGLDWAAAGRVSGDQAADLLSGKAEIATMPVWFASDDGTDVVANRTVAAELDVSLDGLPATVQRIK